MHRELTESIITCFHAVYNTLGYGFSRDIYINALSVEFKKQGIKHTTRAPLDVIYESIIIGEYVADLVVDEKIIISIKIQQPLAKADINQLMHQLAATDKEVGLLLVFAVKPEAKRLKFDNEEKKHKAKA